MLGAVTAGIILVLEIALWRSKAPAHLRWAAGLFGLAVAVYALCTTSLIGSLVAQNVWLRLPLSALVSGDIGFYALLVTVIFEDRKLTWRAFIPSVLLSILGPVVVNSRGITQSLLLAVFIMGCLFLLVRSIVTLLGGWSGDLDDARRRLRRPIVAATGLIALSALTDIALATASRLGLLHSWLTLQREAAITCVTIFVACQLLSSHLRSEPQRAAGTTGEDGADDAVLLVLNIAMSEQEIWRQEGLTIKTLSVVLDVPEYRLRRLILNRLGYRNFPGFINFQRLEAAKLRMTRSESVTIAEIAFDVGFSSLSAFNRAFRDLEGESPKAWRHKHLSTEGRETTSHR